MSPPLLEAGAQAPPIDQDPADSPLHIEVSGLRKEYGDFAAVDDLDLQVRQGEVFALLGPNGAGKTTTLEILVGVRQRTAGEVSVLGQDPGADKRDWRNRIGVVPQNTAEYLDLTVREVIDHFGSFYSDPIPTEELIEMVGLGSKARSRTVSLSGGQKRRLDVAVGVVGRPDMVFLDEPTTGLDPEARREAWQLVTYFRELGATTVLTTHYLDEAETLADRAGIIARGKMLTVGTIAELGHSAGGGSLISFEEIGDVREAVPPELARLEDPVSGMRPTTTLATEQPTETVALLIAWARDKGHQELSGLSVHRPTLEDTYLRLIQKAQDEVNS
ncbi:ABC transporter ATP-binding protein [Ornithinimicrobium faecis]|uniref:ABC transporter ATP-binding protein n=1 Tax=Ornithinimicrobium faecis TaxID=2934158 RepID=UPI0021198502|nr:ABC transporter ATP-binding protein [Ornithinimicrobium sp. HY1745]